MPSNNNNQIVSPERATRNPRGAQLDSKDGLLTPVAVDHIPVFHTVDSLPIPGGNVATALHNTGCDALRDQADAFFHFLATPYPSFMKLNGSIDAYVVLVNIPKSNKVKVIFCLGFGSSPIGSPPTTTDGKLLCLHGDGSPEWGPPQPLVFLVSGLDLKEVTTMDFEEYSSTVAEKGAAFSYPLLLDSELTEVCSIMKIAPIPVYFVYDRIQGDMHAGC